MNSLGLLNDSPVGPLILTLSFRYHVLDGKIDSILSVFDPRRNLKDVSESVGVSVRTVERRLNEMSESHAV